MYRTDDVRDNVSDLEVTVSAAYEDPTVQEFLDDVYRNEEALNDADFAAMEAAAKADGLDPAPFHDLTPEKYEAIMAMMPQNTGWMPEVAYDANAETPFRAQLRRGTPNGPDMIRLPSFYTAENALTAAVLYLINMTLVNLGHGDAATREAMAAVIEYAKR